MTTRPRVLYCTDTWPPQLNGVSVVTALSVEGLERRGWEVAVVSPRYPDSVRDVFPPDGSPATPGLRLTVPSAPMPGYPDIRLAMPWHGAVTQMIRRFRPQLVHAATEFAIGWTGQRAARRAGIPAVSSYHTDFSRYTEAYGVPRLRGLVQRYLVRFHRHSARVFTPGSTARRELEALGVPNVALWGRGVDLELFDPARRDREELVAQGIPRDAVVFLHVGRLAAEKGVERILDAFALSREQLPPTCPIHLVIAGNGPRGESLRASAPTGVTFLGNLDRGGALPRLYASADAFVFASHTETLGLVILEAMASGLPVIAARAGGVADHLVDDVNGLEYLPGDVSGMATAMVAVANSERLRRRLAGGARRTAEALSWELELDRLAGHYHEVIADALCLGAVAGIHRHSGAAAVTGP